MTAANSRQRNFSGMFIGVLEIMRAGAVDRRSVWPMRCPITCMDGRSRQLTPNRSQKAYPLALSAGKKVSGPVFATHLLVCSN
jgi:hypothetical protein